MRLYPEIGFRVVKIPFGKKILRDDSGNNLEKNNNCLSHPFYGTLSWRFIKGFSAFSHTFL
jgi:hypothetical protein